MPIRVRAALLGLAAGLCGCAVGPAYAPPVANPPARFFGDAGSPAPAGDEARWWEAFGDPALDALETRALAADLSVRQALARVEEARAQARIAHAALGPTVEASAQASDTKLSKNTSIGSLATALSGAGAGRGGPNLSQAGLPGNEVTVYQAGFDASWELDLFGGARHAAEAAGARVEAADWSVADARTTLAAEVAQAYFQHHADLARLAIADEAIGVQRELLATAEARARAGLTAITDPNRMRRSLVAAQGARAALVADRDAQTASLAALLAEPAETVVKQLPAEPVGDLPPAFAPDPLVSVPPGLPSELLRRRPDIRVAERRLAAATADVGAAEAALYPQISLTGGVSLVSSSLADLISSDSLQPTGAARIALPIFDGGRARAGIAQRQAQVQEASVAYQQAVLGALRDVSTALVRLSGDRDRAEQAAASQAAADGLADTAEVQYRAGLTTAIEPLSVRADALAAADARLQAEAQARLDIVSLHKALGGGWSAAGAQASDKEN